MNTVLIIPTGIGAEIGGHAGDANPIAKLLASVSDILITHPNVVNASDVNEMTKNTWYVEGSILDRLLEGELELKQPKFNKILVVANTPVPIDTINATSSARATIGIDASILQLKIPLEMIATMKNGKASGIVKGWQELIKQVRGYNFDALAIHTPITVHRGIALNYFRNGGTNPWGGVEAKASKLIANILNKPVAHAPICEVSTKDTELYNFKEVVDPRIAPEAISVCYLHCVLKGLHKASRIGKGLSVKDVDCLITPINCVGRPHRACLKAGIPIIAVKENKTVLNDKMQKEFIIVDNYLEAAGLVVAMREGIHPSSVRRPIEYTKIIKET